MINDCSTIANRISERGSSGGGWRLQGVKSTVHEPQSAEHYTDDQACFRSSLYGCWDFKNVPGGQMAVSNMAPLTGD